MSQTTSFNRFRAHSLKICKAHAKLIWLLALAFGLATRLFWAPLEPYLAEFNSFLQQNPQADAPAPPYSLEDLARKAFPLFILSQLGLLFLQGALLPLLVRRIAGLDPLEGGFTGFMRRSFLGFFTFLQTLAVSFGASILFAFSVQLIARFVHYDGGFSIVSALVFWLYAYLLSQLCAYRLLWQRSCGLSADLRQSFLQLRPHFRPLLGLSLFFLVVGFMVNSAINGLFIPILPEFLKATVSYNVSGVILFWVAAFHLAALSYFARD